MKIEVGNAVFSLARVTLFVLWCGLRASAAFLPTEGGFM